MISTRPRQTALQRSRASILLALLCLGVVLVPLFAAPVPANKPTPYPAWWFEREVIRRTNPDDPAQASPIWPDHYPSADDYAAANGGQLKSIASKAIAEMNAKLPGGAGSALNNLASTWQAPPDSGTARDDYATVNLGQLKAIAKPFYDRLTALGLATAYPWNGDAAQDDNYATANLGQLKHLFAFNWDVDGNGLADMWELANFGSLGIDPNADPDGDGLTNRDEFLTGSNPHEYYEGRARIVRIVSGDQQMVAAGQDAPEPLVIEVVDGYEQPMVNAPVHFAQEAGDGLLIGDNSAGATADVRTAGNGRASVAYRMGTNVPMSRVRVQAGMDLGAPSAVFTIAMSRASDVVLNPSGGRFSTMQDVTVTAGVGEQIHYTLDGSEPTDSSPWVSSGGSIKIYETETLKARATAPNRVWGSVSSAAYRITGAVTAGFGHQVVLRNDRTVWAWGFNSSGHLGNGTFVTSQTPVQVLIAANQPLTNVIAIGAGQEHTVALRADGTVWSWGLNADGQLGIGAQTASRAYATQIPGLADIRAIAVGWYHNLALKSDGSVWAWGYNGDGELGDGTLDDRSLPFQLSAVSNAVKIFAGAYQSFAISDNRVLAWGSDYNGELGDSNPGTALPTPTAISSLAPAVSLGGGWGFSFVIDAAGSARGFGYNRLGELGIGVSSGNQGTSPNILLPTLLSPDSAGVALSGIAAISGGGDHGLAVSESGQLWAWGSNDWKQVSNTTDGFHSVPVPLTLGVPGRRVETVAAGPTHSLAITDDGKVWTWGRFARFDSNGNVLEESVHTTPESLATFVVQRTQDQDGDGLPKWKEDQNGTSDQSTDSDHDGMPDAWEIAHNLDPAQANADADDDSDGLSNIDEYAYGTNPADPDTDGDGYLDGVDGWPTIKEFHPPRLPEPHYTVIDLGPGYATAINNKNEVVGKAPANAFVWRNGVAEAIANNDSYAWPADINDGGAVLYSSFQGNSLGYYVDNFKFADGSNRQVTNLDPNIDYSVLRFDSVQSLKLNNQGAITGSVTHVGSNWAAGHDIGLFWSSPIAVPAYRLGLPDDNDRVLNIAPGCPYYVKDHNGHIIEGAYDNRKGFDDGVRILALNNQGHAVGCSFDVDFLGSYGEPVYYGQSHENAVVWMGSDAERIGSGFACTINDNDIVAGNSDVPFPPNFVAYKDGLVWKQVFLGYWPPIASSHFNSPKVINNNLQILSQDYLLHNQRLVRLNDLAPGWRVEGADMNEAGAIVASAYKESNGQVDWNVPHAILLLPVDIAVDADRNGIIEFGKDTTSVQKPFRYWINDDHDHSENDDDLSGDANYSDSIINGIRDLEDVTQVKFKIPQVLIDMAKTGTAQLGLKWKDVTQGSPAVRIWSGSPNIDKPDYLKDPNMASTILGQNNLLVGSARLVSGTTSVWLRNNLMNDATSDTVNLLMEGVSVGTGKLTFMIKVGTQESEGPSINLKLLNVRQMYERGKITLDAPDIPNPWSNPNPPALTWVWDPWKWQSDIDLNADKKTIAFVHGWRMPYDEYLQWGDTTFKRLWHLGYKGRFYTFRWPTYHGDNNGPNPADIYKPGGTTYNPSEYRAWLSGPALANFVNGLPNPNARYLIAHSMGNVVSGAALRNNMQVTRYAMCNAAMAAMAYDETIVDNDYETPDTDSDQGTRQAFGLANKFNPAGTEIINFSLPNDYALSQWSANNEFFKPQPFADFTRYAYGRSTEGHRDTNEYKLRYETLYGFADRPVTSLPEAMGYVTQSRSRAAGAKQSTRGSVTSFVNMGQGGFEFGDQHSAEWVYSIQKTYPFWKEILKKFDVDVTNR